MDTAPAGPHDGPEGTGPQMPGHPADPGDPAGLGDLFGFPDDTDRDGEVDVLYLAGQRPASPGEWLQVTAADGAPGADFLARILPAGGRHADGGDVLVHLAADSGDREPRAVRAGVWAVVSGLLVPVAAWDRQDPDGWPEQIRATVAFAMSVLTELEEHGADLGARRRIDLDGVVVTATAGIPLGATSGTAATGR